MDNRIWPPRPNVEEPLPPQRQPSLTLQLLALICSIVPLSCSLVYLVNAFFYHKTHPMLLLIALHILDPLEWVWMIAPIFGIIFAVFTFPMKLSKIALCCSLLTYVVSFMTPVWQ